MFGRATIRLGIGPHSSALSLVNLSHLINPLHEGRAGSLGYEGGPGNFPYEALPCTP